MILAGEVVVQADGELVRIGRHLGRSGVGMHSIGTGWKIGQWVSRQHFRDTGVYWHDKRLAGISRHVYSLALLRRGDRKDLGGPKHLAKALILSKVKCLSPAVVNVGNHNRATIGKSKFVAAERGNSFRSL